MKAKILIAGLFMLMITACSKDKYNTVPELTFENVNGTVFPINATLVFKLQVLDKEGDINTETNSGTTVNDTMWVEKISYSCGEDGHILVPNVIPSFTATRYLKADIDVTLTYGQDRNGTGISGCLNKDDSCYFRFWIHDRAGHVSDTVKSPTLKLLKG